VPALAGVRVDGVWQAGVWPAVVLLARCQADLLPVLGAGHNDGLVALERVHGQLLERGILDLLDPARRGTVVGPQDLVERLHGLDPSRFGVAFLAADLEGSIPFQVVHAAEV